MSIIHPKIHTTVASALECKLRNSTLSPKTLKKLTVIANREFGGDASRVFGKASPGTPRFNGDAAGLRSAISSQLDSIRSPGLKQVVSQWLKQLDAPATCAQAPARPEPVPDYPGASSGPARLTSLLKTPEPDYKGADPVRDYRCVELFPFARLIDKMEQAHQVQIRSGDGGGKVRRVAPPVAGNDDGRPAQSVVKGRELLRQFVEEASELRFSTGELTRFWEAALSVPEINDVIPPETLEGVIRLLEYPAAWTNYQLGVSAVRPMEPKPPSAAMLAAVIQASGISFE
jgi:hypothetical protein